ncbi:hypothetical protein BN434_0261 [Erwinia amylovora CFBP 2585]|nr:hypothetical protein BN434_0261 [Erwinia amylovora CFBP 2585]
MLAKIDIARFKKVREILNRLIHLIALSLISLGSLQTVYFQKVISLKI